MQPAPQFNYYLNRCSIDGNTEGEVFDLNREFQENQNFKDLKQYYGYKGQLYKMVKVMTFILVSMMLVVAVVTGQFLPLVNSLLGLGMANLILYSHKKFDAYRSDEKHRLSKIILDLIESGLEREIASKVLLSVKDFLYYYGPRKNEDEDFHKELSAIAWRVENSEQKEIVTFLRSKRMKELLMIALENFMVSNLSVKGFKPNVQKEIVSKKPKEKLIY